MTDRELLDRAARAAGHEITGWNTAQGELVAVMSDGSFWQPLMKNRITDCDGDAFRLAVKLRLGLEWWKNGVSAESAQHGPGVIHHLEDDPCAATRRAIVRAAAAMAGDAP